MISFMVLGGPRSATTWMANLLTTDTTLCLHDPLLEHVPASLDVMTVPRKPRIGISDTSALLYLNWVEKHPAKKIVLWRETAEINDSLRRLGLRELEPIRHVHRVHALPHVKVYPWQAVFKASVAFEICEFFEVPFCRWRFEELKKMNIQPQFSRLPVGKEAVRELVKRVAEEYNS